MQQAPDGTETPHLDTAALRRCDLGRTGTMSQGRVAGTVVFGRDDTVSGEKAQRLGDICSPLARLHPGAELAHGVEDLDAERELQKTKAGSAEESCVYVYVL